MSHAAPPSHPGAARTIGAVPPTDVSFPRRLMLGALLAGGLRPARAQEASLQVLHWWTSAGERRAADALAARLAEAGIRWRDAAVPGGAGVGAAKVLRSRVLAGDAPEAAQMVGATLADWADTGLLLELDGVAREGQWAQRLFPEIERGVRHRGHVVAVPLGIHRSNLLFVNLALFERHRVALPRDWDGWAASAQALQRAGVLPLVQSREPWQVAALFEALLLGSGGPALHRDLFVRLDARAAASPRLAEALARLLHLRAWAGAEATEQPWTQALERLRGGGAAMMVMGDWAKAELVASGWVPGEHFACLPVPGTAGQHLYSVDSLAMFARDYAQAPAQERMAAALVAPALQADYNRAKGSVPVRRDADPAAMDPCARESWTLFARGGAVPSLTHRMATGESSRDALVAELHRFYLQDTPSVPALQQRLAALLRVLAPADAEAARNR